MDKIAGNGLSKRQLKVILAVKIYRTVQKIYSRVEDKEIRLLMFFEDYEIFCVSVDLLCYEL